MSKIEEIDYDQIISKASKIASEANSMQNAVKDAFSRIQAMSQDWFGISYDNFVNTVNMSIAGLNRIFEVTVSDIPHEIAAKAKSYASANQGSVSSGLNEQVAIMLTDIPRTNKGAKIRFRSAEVESAQQDIKSKFENAKSYADEAKATSSSLESDWQSISGNTNIQELKMAFERLKNILDHLYNALDGQVTAQATVVNALETAAGTVQATGEVLENAVDAAKDAAQAAVNKIQQSAADVWTNLTGKN